MNNDDPDAPSGLPSHVLTDAEKYAILACCNWLKNHMSVGAGDSDDEDIYGQNWDDRSDILEDAFGDGKSPVDVARMPWKAIRVCLDVLYYAVDWQWHEEFSIPKLQTRHVIGISEADVSELIDHLNPPPEDDNDGNNDNWFVFAWDDN